MVKFSIREAKQGIKQEGFDFDDEIKDWDVTVADGLDELEKEEKEL